MKHFKTRVLLPGLTIVFCVAASLIDQSAAPSQNTPPKTSAREEAYRANNIGVALLEQYKYKEAADAFKRALQLDPALTIARINFGIALFNVPDLVAAQRELQSAATAAPTAPQPQYVLGLMAKTQNKPAEAIAAFQKVLAIDPQDVGANVNLGQLYAQQRKYAEAVTVLRTGLAAEPYNTTALYNLGTALIRSGQREEGQEIIQQFQALRERGSGTTLGTNYLEQGRYAEAISSTGAEPELIDQNSPAITFTDVTSSVLPTADWPVDVDRTQSNGAVLLFDYDLDGDLDLFEVAGVRQRLARNDGAGKFADVTASAGALAKAATNAGTSAVAGDFDNDGRPDLFVVRPGTSTLYHNDGNGSFSDVTAAAKIPPYPSGTGATAFVDYDHDGDLDIFIAGHPYLLLRNNGDRTFTDQTAEAKVADHGIGRAVVPTDFDNRRDVDLLVAANEKVSLWRNMRDGTFRDVATDVGLGDVKGATCVAAGDFNKDGFTDFYIGGAGLALSNGKERFQLVPSGADVLPPNASQFIDLNNDGLLDLVMASDKGVLLVRNAGSGNVQVSVLLPTMRSLVLASGDLDNDGDTDLVFGVPGGGLKVARNNGGNVNHSLRVGLTGRVSNRTGVGAKIEIRSGSLSQKLETYSAYPAPAPADVVFGLGKRTSVDAVRVLWPAGIVQAETEIAAGSTSKTALAVSLTELDRKPSSCPYLYVWNGERFEFVTDFLGGGEMGHLDAPGSYNMPDPDEYVRIDGDRFKPRNGHYDLRITNELEEALFLDHVELIAVAHPRAVEVYPNEGLTAPPPKFKLFATRNAQPPLSAIDEQGHDVLPRIARVDRQYPDDFKLHQIRGFADEHTLTLGLNKHDGRTLLLLTGWTDYAWSSDNLAASQSGKSLQLPALQVKDKRGQWQTVIENIGIPVGRPQTIVVDLTGKFLSDSREVRIVTNMRIYWDQILVDTSNGDFPTRLTRLAPFVANLRWRGFSLEHSPDARQPMTYDYKNVSFTSPWKVMTGRYTREGDVRELLHSVDDMFAISRPGDELVLSFAEDKLPPLPDGWTRTFLLYADGFSKEMDINSASPDQIGPLPFHGMTRYPYTWPERYPLTPARRRYLETYNTRIVKSPVPSIALELVK
ncbi:MAG TPA: FG-GAP-like repeat-containing protein [Pyrinomonadaceae bacterium]|jgi:tetratricopeptide (TPR) repeat protein|nr:FG-GAP-like repeat-containing protein [Pyrinomonadaceae bacterium]